METSSIIPVPQIPKQPPTNVNSGPFNPSVSSVAQFPAKLLVAWKFSKPQEGGFSDDPHDKGGVTNLGMTQATISAFEHRAVSIEEMRNLTDEKVLPIYRVVFWDHIHGDDLKLPLGVAAFDYAINSGPAHPIRDLQRLCGIPSDGVMGPQTLSAIAKRDGFELALLLCQTRLAMLQRDPDFKYFGRDWTRRVSECEAFIKNIPSENG